eukprot:TRINITY_DN89247_c0_g1_i1.p2 TRINITY_DN89247_c0_g1~~TRINITY_DN89247_c0_g1_i1.p2  ORF type:complete len:111 (-),score=41.62 TRINITY_DN89247_c0_g1_i1:260-592(-)
MADGTDEEKKEYFRQIDAPQFFDKMLTALLIQQPAEPVAFFQDFVTKTQQGNSVATDGEYSPKLMDDTAYIRKHNITGYVNQLLEDLLRERPVDYLGFYAKWLQEHPTTK